MKATFGFVVVVVRANAFILTAQLIILLLIFSQLHSDNT